MSIISKDSVILKQARNIKKLSLSNIADKVVKENETDLLNLQRDQMRSGQNAKGDNPDYTPYSLSLKDPSTYLAKKPLMDFYSTGSFQDKMFIEKCGFFNSKDSKTGKLVGLYGEEILDPNKQTKEIQQSIVDGDVFKIFHKEINK